MTSREHSTHFNAAHTFASHLIIAFCSDCPFCVRDSLVLAPAHTHARPLTALNRLHMQFHSTFTHAFSRARTSDAFAPLSIVCECIFVTQRFHERAKVLPVSQRANTADNAYGNVKQLHLHTQRRQWCSAAAQIITLSTYVNAFARVTLSCVLARCRCVRDARVLDAVLPLSCSRTAHSIASSPAAASVS